MLSIGVSFFLHPSGGEEGCHRDTKSSVDLLLLEMRGELHQGGKNGPTILCIINHHWIKYRLLIIAQVGEETQIMVGRPPLQLGVEQDVGQKQSIPKIQQACLTSTVHEVWHSLLQVNDQAQ